MAAPRSPAQRLRSRTADFLRGAKRDEDFDDAPQPPPKQPTPTTPFPTAPSSEQASIISNSSSPKLVSPSSPKSKISFPFLGRSRKKSQNATPSVDPRVQNDNALPSFHTRDGSDPQILDIDSSSSPAPYATATSAKPSPSFGAKISAHFTPSKSRRSLRVSSDVPPVTTTASPDIPPGSSPYLRVSESQYFDSISSSNSSGGAPATPKPTPQPTITVSVPDSLVEEFREIFTYAPGDYSPSQERPRGIGILGNPGDNLLDSKPSVVQQRKGSSASIKSSQSEGSRRKSSRSTHHSDAVTDKQSKRRTIDVASAAYTRSSQASSKSSPTLPRQHSTRRSGTPSLPDSPPPPIPLPPAPSMTSLHSIYSVSSLNITSSRKSISSANQSYPHDIRPRANTIASVATRSSHSDSPVPSLPGKISITSLEQIIRESAADKENLDNATNEELKRIIKAESARFTELASYLSTMVDVHSAEKSSLERRIALLEHEAKKREKEMKGLRWLMMNEAAVNAGQSDQTSTTSSFSSRPPPRRYRSNSLNQTNQSTGRSKYDSGTETESYSRTSGLETAASDSNLAAVIAKRRKRHNSRTGPTTTGLGLDFTGTGGGTGNGPYLTPLGKRSSLSSFTSSPASSTSSLGLPVTASVLMPGLSAIPEGPPSPNSQTYHIQYAQHQHYQEQRPQQHHDDESHPHPHNTHSRTNSQSSSYSRSRSRSRSQHEERPSTSSTVTTITPNAIATTPTAGSPQSLPSLSVSPDDANFVIPPARGSSSLTGPGAHSRTHTVLSTTSTSSSSSSGSGPSSRRPSDEEASIAYAANLSKGRPNSIYQVLEQGSTHFDQPLWEMPRVPASGNKNGSTVSFH